MTKVRSQGQQGPVHDKVKKCNGDQYDFTGFNCYRCVEQAMKECGLSVPIDSWPNWPVNPGPQPGEPGYSQQPHYGVPKP